MNKKFLTALCVLLAASIFLMQPGYGHITARADRATCTPDSAATRNAVMDIINTVVNASGKFDIDAVANLYTPNAVVADEEPPFSWSGPTAGVQWVQTVEKTCKDFKLKNLKGKIGDVNVYLQTDESIYIVVPVVYSGSIRNDHFEEDGAYTFVFRLVSGKWLIKSQAWLSRKGL